MCIEELLIHLPLSVLVRMGGVVLPHPQLVHLRERLPRASVLNMDDVQPVPACLPEGKYLHLDNAQHQLRYGRDMHARCMVPNMATAGTPCIGDQVQNQLNAFIILAAGLWCILALTTMLLQELGSPASIASLWGWAVSITQVLLMASPLSGLIEAFRTRSSANFHLGVCIMNLLSSSMWTLYSVVRPLELLSQVESNIRSCIAANVPPG